MKTRTFEIIVSAVVYGIFFVMLGYYAHKAYQHYQPKPERVYTQEERIKYHDHGK